MSKVSRKQFRALSISRTLFPKTTLSKAFSKLTFVQADPIRSPARAQDLILRHRVNGYCFGELELRYPELNLEEDFLYAHGFMLPEVWKLIHPRKSLPLSKLDKDVLKFVESNGKTHPSDLKLKFGKKTVVNAWGGKSHAVKKSLDVLHHNGLLRIARRDKGIRVYQAVSKVIQFETETQRLEKLIFYVVGIFAPVVERTLQESLFRLRRDFGKTKPVIRKMLKQGRLVQVTIDGINYITRSGLDTLEEPPKEVKFLAPFDPVVWDRRRFEHLWGWKYRFEAYTPADKRVRGYYAMPLLWHDKIIGWANAKVRDRELEVETGFVDKKPTDKFFTAELENEKERLRIFLDAK